MVCAAWCTPSAAARNRPDNLTRARLAYASMQGHFYRPAQRLYAETYGNRTSRYATAWPFSQAMAATIALAAASSNGDYREDLLERAQGLEAYWNDRINPRGYDSAVRKPFGRGGQQYNDDNAWIGLQLMRLYELMGAPPAAGRASDVLAFIRSSWDNDPRHPCRGGVVWARRLDILDRNTVSNAPTAELALDLYRATRNPDYLAVAKATEHWVDRCLRAPNSLYWDHITTTGYVNRAIWTYNQGAMIGANLQLYCATTDRRYLSRALRVGRASVSYFDARRLASQPPFFNAILADELMRLSALVGDRRYRSYVQAYADGMWDHARNRHTNLYVFGPRPVTQLLEQAAMVRVFAALASPRSTACQ
jgi:hypothetical protein